MIKIRIESSLEGVHIADRFFVGEEGRTMVLAGTLRFSVISDISIWQLLGAMLLLGAGRVNQNYQHVTVETVGDVKVIEGLQKLNLAKEIIGDEKDGHTTETG